MKWQQSCMSTFFGAEKSMELGTSLERGTWAQCLGGQQDKDGGRLV